ncbi:copper-binding protein, plastocyanin/azurin family protein [Candidatus Scalindua japonica]|uniref:Copper-binding protein, plastocyanin/azurin family protein n=1 Tax=Candidatus Scalindua japonica TaxID=1284222 RepID=A0A286TX44_9BACT|nr:plastocyanin/azurin family copper-binding protein [Candidatus Scalindua japonica]GAX60462.1 copper-binding protein, plastocyanin/azurin family protein [Candidatus Scalindua japonica]
MKKNIILLNIAIILTIFSFSGCSKANQTDSSSDSNSSTTPLPQTKTHIVEMTGDYEFVPSKLTIKRGDSVKWVVTGNKPHEVASGKAIKTEDGMEGVPDGLWDSGKMASGSFTYTFHTTGTFPYYCDSHADQGMTGTITVE